ncbi:MAG: hypothetical protein R3A44_09230 [Caldilineaceae bacterium]
MGGATTFYPFAHYEVTGSTNTKYYTFNGMRVAMRKGSTLYYIHTDHLGGAAAETNSGGTVVTTQSYRAYGKQRDGAPFTGFRFTGQAYWALLAPLIT